MAYISKRYLKEKFEKAKWDMEHVLKINDTAEDKIPAEKANEVVREIEYCFNAMLKELKKGKENGDQS